MIDHEEARLSLADLLLPGLADPTRSAAIRAHVHVCDECSGELAELRRVDELLRACGPLPEPSLDLERRVRAIAGSEPRDAEPRVTAPPERQPAIVHPPIEKRRRGGAVALWHSVGAWRVAAAVAAVAAVAAFAFTRHGGFSQQQKITLNAAPGWAVRGDAQLGREDGRQVVRVRLRGLHPLADNGYYELWLARTPTDRVSLGAVQLAADGTVSATIPVPALEDGYKGVWLTAEPDDHNPAWSKRWVVKARFA